MYTLIKKYFISGIPLQQTSWVWWHAFVMHVGGIGRIAAQKHENLSEK
jgi:hypothetical protein